MPPKKAPKKEVEPDDEFMKMTGNELQQQVKLLKEKLQSARTQRNYIQMDRDMVEQYYHNTQKEIDEVKIKIVNKETEAAQLEEDHRVEVKVYLQKVKHLEYEQEKNNKEIEEDGQDAKEKENKYFDERIEAMKKEKMQHKEDLTINEKANINDVQKTQMFDERQLKAIKDNFDKKLQELTQKYEQRLKKLEEDLKLKQKVEIHELEERKNLHINELMYNHEKAFKELKKYYNDITSENLNLIKGQKEEIARIHAKIQSNSKLLAEMKEKNNALLAPLKKSEEDLKVLQDLLKQYKKHKMSLNNLKSKLINLREKISKLEMDSKELDIKYEKVIKEKQDLEQKFEKITQEVSKHAELQNVYLNQKLQSFQNQYESKEAQLKQVIDQANLDPGLYQQLIQKIQTSIESKNILIKNLKYSIHHATKAYNDAIRVYEAKLVEFGIPPEELGFQPLETITSTMPAGLVSS